MARELLKALKRMRAEMNRAIAASESLYVALFGEGSRYDGPQKSWEQLPSDVLRPSIESFRRFDTCLSCEHYHGKGYGHALLHCAMHPYGPETEECEDWEGATANPAACDPAHPNCRCITAPFQT